MSKTLKAYVVREDSEGNCVVAFATNSATARREGGDELGISFEEVESCRREPSLDQYAPGPVPLHATLAIGWWHECGNCGMRFDEEGRHGDCFGREEEAEREDAFEPVECHGHNYCSSTCMMRAWAERRDRAARESAAIEAAVMRWPSATSLVAREYGRAHPLPGFAMRVRFNLPGLEHGVDWAMVDQKMYVAPSDADAFHRLYGKETHHAG